MAELARQLSSYLWRGSVNFKINDSRPLFTIIFKLKMVNSRVKEFSPLIKWVLGSVASLVEWWIRLIFQVSTHSFWLLAATLMWEILNQLLYETFLQKVRIVKSCAKYMKCTDVWIRDLSKFHRLTLISKFLEFQKCVVFLLEFMYSKEHNMLILFAVYRVTSMYWYGGCGL